jgi:hypothetical protein
MVQACEINVPTTLSLNPGPCAPGLMLRISGALLRRHPTVRRLVGFLIHDARFTVTFLVSVGISAGVAHGLCADVARSGSVGMRHVCQTLCDAAQTTQRACLAVYAAGVTCTRLYSATPLRSPAWRSIVAWSDYCKPTAAPASRVLVFGGVSERPGTAKNE